MNLNPSKLLNKLFAILSIFTFSFYSWGQYSPEFNQLNEIHKEENIVILNNEYVIKIIMDKEEIRITKSSVKENLYLTDNAKLFSKKSVSYSNFFQLDNIKASSFQWENGKYNENKIKDFRRKDELSGSFHDDVKSINFLYPGLSKGSKTRLEVQETITNPRFLPAFYFGVHVPTVKSKLIIEVDKGIELIFKKYNTEGLDLKFSKVEKGSRTIYTWEAQNIDKVEMESGTPSANNYYPHIVPVIKQYQTKKSKEPKTLLSKVDDLYDWYYSLTKNINQDDDDSELISLVQELIKDKPSDLEKVKAIYYWVQTNIKYIAFEYDLGGFIPRESNMIYKKKYGDCKDNSSILFQMLKIAKLQGHLTWIGTRDIPYTYKDLPTPKVDNHMILTYFDNGTPYFLDATGRYVDINYPTSFIQGKEALVGKQETYELVKVPVVPANKNGQIDSSEVKIEGKNLIGKGQSTFKGYQKNDIFSALEQITEDKKKKVFYKSLLRKGTNKFLIDSYKENNMYEYEKDFIMDFTFNVKDYVLAYEDELYVNLNLNKVLSYFDVEDDRKTDFEIDYKQSYDYKVVFEIPDDYEVIEIPENISLQNENIKIDFIYNKIEGNKIELTHLVTLDYLVLELDEQNAYREIIKKGEKAYKEVLVLKKKK